MNLTPSDPEAEAAVVSMLLMHPERAPETIEKLPPETFIAFPVANVYRVICRLYRCFQPLEMPRIIAHLRDNGELEKIGGSAAVSEMLTYLHVPVSYLDGYVKRIAEKHALRQIIDAAISIADKARQPESTPQAVSEAAESVFARLSLSSLSDVERLPCRPFREVIGDVMDKMEERASKPGTIAGISTGFLGIDERTGGMQRGRLWIVAGETSDGKSTLCQNMIESACAAGHYGIIYSYEMPDTECAERVICSHGRVDNGEIMHGRLSHASQTGLMRAVSELQTWKMDVVDVETATIEDICKDITSRTKEARRINPQAELVACIDYLQLANTRESFGTNREREVAHISKTAKQCAKRNKITILMPSQLNDDGKLRESRAISHDADTVLIIRKPKPEKGQKEVDEATTLRDIVCPKNRGGKKNWKSPMRLVGEHFQFVAQ